MDKTVPAGAALLLDFIASYEAPHGYGTVYGNKQGTLPASITTMRLAEVIAAQTGWTRTFGSSACGRYQFMRNTLLGLKTELGLSGLEFFDPGFQDRLGYHLLKRRGYAAFMAGTMTPTRFGLGLAQEWASFPVLVNCQGAHRPVVRGQTYYAGDGQNHALVKPEAVEAALTRALGLFAVPGPMAAAPTPSVIPAASLPRPAPAAPRPQSPAPPVAAARTAPVATPSKPGFWATWIAPLFAKPKKDA